MIDVFLYRRHVDLGRFFAPVVRPFEYAETRWEWPGFFGYPVAVVGRKPA
jgi:hypothetical protein